MLTVTGNKAILLFNMICLQRKGFFLKSMFRKFLLLLKF